MTVPSEQPDLPAKTSERIVTRSAESQKPPDGTPKQELSNEQLEQVAGGVAIDAPGGFQ